MAADPASTLQGRSSAYPRLFEPISLGGLKLPNRIVMGSMHTGFESLADGMEQLAAFYAERARGGVALIVTGGFSPNAAGELRGHRAQMSEPQDALRHRIVTDAVHDAGGRIILQLLHSGRYGQHPDIVAPSPIRSPIGSTVPRELDDAEIERTIEDFVQATRLAQQAGYDGVEIMGCEGYLINQFLARRTNMRTDRWGGSLDNRMRFPLALVNRARRAAGRDFIISYRHSALDLVEDGLSGDEVVTVARAVEQAGASLLNTGFGWHEARIPTIAQPVPPAGFAWAVKRITDAVDIPVVASNRINNPETAEAILERGEADMVALARALLADPAFAAKARAGDRVAISICISCNQACLDHYLRDETASCLVNPQAGRETTLVYRPTSVPKRIAVVGGGPAGMSCAAVAAERGHQVVLFESSPTLGGQFNFARHVPGKGDFAEVISFHAERLSRAGAEVRLSTPAQAADLAGFDEIVFATGVEPRIPAIAGIETGPVVSYADLLSGRAQAGRKVVIIGAGGIGVDVALYLVGRGARSTTDPAAFRRHWGISTAIDAPGGLAEEGGEIESGAHDVTILKRSTTPFGQTLGRSTGWAHRAELARHDVKVIGGADYRRIGPDGVTIAVEGSERFIAADTIIICAGQDSCVQPTLEGKIPHLIGGARLAGELDAERAILEGAELAARL